MSCIWTDVFLSEETITDSNNTNGVLRHIVNGTTEIPNNFLIGNINEALKQNFSGTYLFVFEYQYLPQYRNAAHIYLSELETLVFYNIKLFKIITFSDRNDAVMFKLSFRG